MTVSEQIADLKATFVAELDKSNKAAAAELQKVQATLQQAQADLATAKQTVETLGNQVKDLESQLKASTEGKAKADQDLAAANTKVADLEKKNAELSAKEQDLDKRSNLKAATILAQRGISMPLTEEKNGNPGGEKSAESELKGIAKVRAAFKKQFQK